MKNNEPLYVVSGFMRTGTSMMMRALEAGGLEAVKRQSREEMRKRYADEKYNPNEGGLYELETNDFKDINFPRQFQGKLIKCLAGGIERMCVMPKVKIIFMRRDMEEIRQSYQAFFSENLNMVEERFVPFIENSLQILQNRKDTEVVVLWYRDVLKDPAAVFTALKENGWPIDVAKCVEIINPNLCRFKKEDLVIGVI